MINVTYRGEGGNFVCKADADFFDISGGVLKLYRYSKEGSKISKVYMVFNFQSVISVEKVEDEDATEES